MRFCVTLLPHCMSRTSVSSVDLNIPSTADCIRNPDLSQFLCGTLFFCPPPRPVCYPLYAATLSFKAVGNKETFLYQCIIFQALPPVITHLLQGTSKMLS